MKIIIVGAGAAGLMAANILAKKGIHITLLESLDRLGGRIHSHTPQGFSNMVEAGAEFIHGDLPLTLKLMKKAGLAVIPVKGKMYSLASGRMSSDFGEGQAWGTFYEAMRALKRDCTVEELLMASFRTKAYDNLRAEVRDMAQGLDLADISRLSVFSVREEWPSGETQYRPLTGYSPLLQWLYNDAVSANVNLYFNQHVQGIRWESGKAKVQAKARSYDADAVILTVPVPLMNEAISFHPHINQTLSLFKKIGFGQVIKMALEFDYPFWEEYRPDLGFLFTEDGFTFWTQLPSHSPLLVGWIGDQYAEKYHSLSDDALTGLALQKLKKAFSKHAGKIDVILRTAAVFRYTQHSPTGGGYSWMALQSKKAITKLNEGIEDTIWFAGEALHPASGTATVEAALQSGRATAMKILRKMA